jgi:hypothetical protein
LSQPRQGRNERCKCGSGKKNKYCHGSINYREGLTPEPKHKVTETELKLRDAENQLQLAMQNAADEDLVRSCINAFITFGRSVTMVMEGECHELPGLLDWYKSKTAGFKTSPEVAIWAYFAENRTYTTHSGVIKPVEVIASVTGLEINGVPQPTSPNASMSFIRFANPPGEDWMDSGGIFRLCQSYLRLLRLFVTEWLARRVASQRPT